MESCIDRFLDKGDPESHKLYRVRKTLMEMLHDRGFFVSDDDLRMSLEQFRSNFGNVPNREQLRFTTYKRDNPRQRVIVYFAQKADTEKVGIRDVRFYLQSMRSDNLQHAILIVPGIITAQAKKALHEDSSRFRIEIFEDADLFMNITKHVLIPKHEILTEKGKNKLLKQYSVKEHQLPRMLESDPLARYYGLKRGKIMKLTYAGDVTGHYEQYRIIW
eukprot:TRINITY_DN29018_c0_g1_i1.p1 TRINITY_DN29018_c0_g1~~TRINITY_DN29018_c0_g1_i1.p1  ORF type:complete len:218 (+),score=24.09 TRINITY_DN29018_c0_g1_i1:213-866(+)